MKFLLWRVNFFLFHSPVLCEISVSVRLWRDMWNFCFHTIMEGYVKFLFPYNYGGINTFQYRKYMLYTYQGMDVLMHIYNNADQQLAFQASALCYFEWIWTYWKNAAISLNLSLLFYCCYQYCYIIMIWRVVGSRAFWMHWQYFCFHKVFPERDGENIKNILLWWW